MNVQNHDNLIPLKKIFLVQKSDKFYINFLLAEIFDFGVNSSLVL